MEITNFNFKKKRYVFFVFIFLLSFQKNIFAVDLLISGEFNFSPENEQILNNNIKGENREKNKIVIGQRGIVNGDIHLGNKGDNVVLESNSKLQGSIFSNIGDDNITIKDFAIVNREINTENGNDKITLKNEVKVNSINLKGGNNLLILNDKAELSSLKLNNAKTNVVKIKDYSKVDFITVSENGVGEIRMSGGTVKKIDASKSNKNNGFYLNGGKILGNIVGGNRHDHFFISKNARIEGNINASKLGTTFYISGGQIKGEIIGGNGFDQLLINDKFANMNVIRNIDNILINFSPYNTIFTANNPIINAKTLTISHKTEMIMNTNYIEANNFNNYGKLIIRNGVKKIKGNYTHGTKGVLAFFVKNGQPTGKLIIKGKTNLNNGKIELNFADFDIADDITFTVLDSDHPIENRNVELIDGNGDSLNALDPDIFRFYPKFANANKTFQIVIDKKPFDAFMDPNNANYNANNANLAKTLTEGSAKGGSDLKEVIANVRKFAKDIPSVKTFFKKIIPNVNKSMLRAGTSFDLGNNAIGNRLSEISNTIFSNEHGFALIDFAEFNVNSRGQYYSLNRNFYDEPFINYYDKFRKQYKNKNINKKVLYAKNNLLRPKSDIWMQIFGNSNRQRANENFDGFTSKSVGYSIGADGKPTKNTTVGMSVSYVKSDINSVGGSDNTLDVKNCQIGMYGMYEKNNRFLEGILNYGHNRYDSKRIINMFGVNRTALGDYKGNQYGGKIRIGRNYNQNNFQIKPFGSLEYSILDINEFNEKNATGLNLRNVKYDNIHSLVAGIGTRFSFKNITTKSIFIPYLSVEVKHEIDHKNASVAASFEDLDLVFKNDLAKVDRTKLNLGAGFSLYNKNNFSVLASYNYECREHSRGNYGYLKFKYSF